MCPSLTTPIVCLAQRSRPFPVWIIRFYSDCGGGMTLFAHKFIYLFFSRKHTGGRVSIVGLALVNLRSALAISVRYSAARKQFSATDGAEELPVIEYQLQQYRLIPFIAACYAIDRFYMWLAGHHFAQLTAARSGTV